MANIRERMEKEEIEKIMKKQNREATMIKTVMGLGLVLVLVIMSVAIVPAGHKGVLLEWSAVKGPALSEGLHFKIPIMQNILNMDVRTQKELATIDAASGDLQTVTTAVAVNYHIDPSQAPWIYQSIGVEYRDRVIVPAIEEAVKASTATFTAEQLITKRNEMKIRMKEELHQRLKVYNIIVETVSIEDFSFSAEFDKAIEQKVTAEQNALKAERVLEQVKFEAQQRREQAAGEADARLSVATAEAKAIELQGQALRDNPEVVELRAIEKWDGVLPTIMLGGATPFIQIPASATTKRGGGLV